MNCYECIRFRVQEHRLGVRGRAPIPNAEPYYDNVTGGIELMFDNNGKRPYKSCVLMPVELRTWAGRDYAGRHVTLKYTTHFEQLEPIDDVFVAYADFHMFDGPAQQTFSRWSPLPTSYSAYPYDPPELIRQRSGESASLGLYSC